MTLAEIRQAVGVGPEWEVIWTGADPLDPMLHLCTERSERDGPFRARWVSLPYALIAPSGLEVARCEHCHIAYVCRRAVIPE